MLNDWTVLGDPGAASQHDGIFVGESLLQQGDEPLGTFSYRTSLDEIFTKIQRSRANRKLNMAAGKHRENFHGGLIEGIVKFYG